jgi:hypothetical protein
LTVPACPTGDSFRPTSLDSTIMMLYNFFSCMTSYNVITTLGSTKK